MIGLQGLQRDAAERRYQETNVLEEGRREEETTRMLVQEQSVKLDNFQRGVIHGIKALLLGQASTFVVEGQPLIKSKQAYENVFPLECSMLSETTRLESRPERAKPA